MSHGDGVTPSSLVRCDTGRLGCVAVCQAARVRCGSGGGMGQPPAVGWIRQVAAGGASLGAALSRWARFWGQALWFGVFCVCVCGCGCGCVAV